MGGKQNDKRRFERTGLKSQKNISRKQAKWKRNKVALCHQKTPNWGKGGQGRLQWKEKDLVQEAKL